SNLISNAVKYYDPAKPNAYIRISAGMENPEWWLTVEDNGVGISDNHLEKLFAMFYRAHAHGEGSGLGLYIVNEVCKKLGGTVSVKSVYGEGSSFTVRLPLAKS
ncbi:MAG: sensor histidine kinase, partial [Cyclobacteriaceae bacterium]